MYYIYCYTNKINGKKYIGQTNDLKRRDYEHKHNSSDTYFDRAYSKHPNEFKLEILEVFDEYENIKDVMDAMERYHISNLQTQYPNGYNLTEGGQGKKYNKQETQQEDGEIKMNTKIKTSKKAPTTFKDLHLMKGTSLYWKNDPSIRVCVADDINQVLYNGEQYSVSAAATIIFNTIENKNYSSVNGYEYFCTRPNGETLNHMRLRMEDNGAYSL